MASTPEPPPVQRPQAPPVQSIAGPPPVQRRASSPSFDRTKHVRKVITIAVFVWGMVAILSFAWEMVDALLTRDDSFFHVLVFGAVHATFNVAILTVPIAAIAAVAAAWPIVRQDTASH